MNSVYREILKRRSDMTEWLIHFTRHNGDMPAREVLRQILIEGVLRPSWSERGRQRTVYGPVPAVCFSEQPLAAFATYVDARRDTGLTDGYGLLLHKHDVNAAGGRPVIYGLKYVYELDRNQKIRRDIDPQCRVLREDCLPFHEQYRYVTFVPNDTQNAIDWSHEREWRWPADSPHAVDTDCYLLAEAGRLQEEARVHVIVRYDADIIWLQDQLSEFYQSNQVGNIKSAKRRLKHYSRDWKEALEIAKIISLETIERGEIIRFEDSSITYPSLILR
jgi:hypothetical protein